MAETSVPVRTCVGCRERAPVTDLLRVVLRAGALVPDPRRRLPGRGASLHPTPECLRAAERRRAFPRALRLPGGSSAPVEAGPLRAHVLGATAPGEAPPGRANAHERQTAVPPTDRQPAGPHVESRTSSDESAVKSPR
ncbi:YlxR family protein [Geodermatophilus bullaregiensis]|uniref:YlxR family protein n=1 Tax=Geodermatophilus bullaregiensis TaxID=1564160 RepID=UPI0027DD6369|nr:YlxR family protein [Geodermatophilus bullaregiensis]